MSVFRPRCHAILSVVLDGRSPTQPSSEPLMLEATPSTATVTRTGPHSADLFSLEFDARVLPFDPELVASIAVVIYMFNADSLDDRREWAVEDYEMIRGLADEPSLEISDTGTFSFDGRDYTGLLLDTEWDPRVRIPSGRPLDETVQTLADEAAPEGTRARFEVVYESDDIPIPPIVGKARRSTKKNGLWVKPGKSFWDVIYEMCLHEGLVAFVRGERIYITDPLTQTRATVLDAPRIVHGRSLTSLEVSRRLAKERVPQVKVTTYDAAARKHVEVVYPKAKSKITTGLGMKKNEVMILPAPRGVRDRDALERYAKARFLNMARAEAKYRFGTRHLESVNGVDMLRIQAEQPVFIEFDPFNAEHMRALSTDQRIEHLVALGYSQALSTFVATNYQRLDQFRQPYYMRQAEFSFDAESGIDIDIEAANYAHEAREEAEQLREVA